MTYAIGIAPANWIPKDPIIVPAPITYKELEERNEEILKNKNGMSWYLSFKKSCNKIEKNEIKKIESKNIDKK